jgi:hypothetical protein
MHLLLHPDFGIVPYLPLIREKDAAYFYGSSVASKAAATV